MLAAQQQAPLALRERAQLSVPRPRATAQILLLARRQQAHSVQLVRREQA
jgi:hypothetical protein